MSTKFEAIKQREEALMCRTYGRYPIAVVRGKGSRLWDADGKEYVDLLAGIAVTGLGHANDELNAAMLEQAQKFTHVSNLFYQEEQLELAERLLGTCHLSKAFFCNSGAEANESAIKLARRYMQRCKNRPAGDIVTLSGCFHGRTLATVAATGQDRFKDGFAPIPTGFRQVEWGDTAALEAAITPETAGVLVEIVQGEGGIRPMPREYARKIEEICRKKDVLFIVDEVQCGLCRTGKPWAFQHFDLRPDIITVAKALAGGLPMGAMLAGDEVAKGFAVGSHASTFGGGAVVSAVAVASLKIMERDKLAERAKHLGEKFTARIEAMSKKLPGKIKEIRGLGLMIGIELAVPGKAVWEEVIRRGFICNLAHEQTLRLLPALNIEEAELFSFADMLEDVLSDNAK